jgi:hypothetical protein
VTASAGGAAKFVMEDLAKTVIGTSVTFDGVNTLASISAANATTPRLCLQKRFPVFLGTGSGITKITTFETSSIGTFGVGGTSTDATLVLTANNLFVGILESSGFNVTWMKELTYPAG